MESTLTTISIITAILSIVMIVKFFQIASDVKSIRESTYPDLSDANIISLRLSGKTDEMYLIIVRRLAEEYSKHVNYENSQLPESIRKDLGKRRAVAEYNMQLLGRELPAELKSFEAYQSFYRAIRKSID